MLHKHHIVPRHMGGTNEKNNLVMLTIEEHAEAHRLLYEKFNKLEDKIAWKALLGQLNRDEISLETSALGGHNNKNKHKAVPHKQKLSLAAINYWETGGHKDILSTIMINNTISNNHSSDRYKATQSQAMKTSWAKRNNKLDTIYDIGAIQADVDAGFKPREIREKYNMTKNRWDHIKSIYLK
jgi:hypothetical protein